MAYNPPSPPRIMWRPSCGSIQRAWWSECTRPPPCGTLAAVGRCVQWDAQDVEVAIIAGIDPDLAEVEGPGVEAVDAGPAFAAVGRLVDAARVVAFLALAFLGVLGRRPPRDCQTAATSLCRGGFPK